MEIVNRVTKSGMVEGLALTRWVQPFTEQESVMINKSTVVTMVPASIGMSKYYRYVLKSIDTMKLVTSEDIEPTKEELSAIENEEKLNENEISKDGRDKIHTEQEPNSSESKLTNNNKEDEEIIIESDDEKMSLEELIEETSEFLKRNRRTIH